MSKTRFECRQVIKKKLDSNDPRIWDLNIFLLRIIEAVVEKPDIICGGKNEVHAVLIFLGLMSEPLHMISSGTLDYN